MSSSSIPTTTSSSLEFFSQLQIAFDQEYELKEKIRTLAKEVDVNVRKLVARLNTVHTLEKEEDIVKLGTDILQELPGSILHLRNLATSVIPSDQFYKYQFIISPTIQTIIYVVTFAIFLVHRRLVNVAELETILGYSIAYQAGPPPSGFHITLEDTLHAFITFTSELPRLSLNRVTHGDFQTPILIAEFIGDIYRGYQLLNLKNDSLRKRFDGIKYDLKKAEEIVYDLTVRGLAKTSPASVQTQPSTTTEG